MRSRRVVEAPIGTIREGPPPKGRPRTSDQAPATVLALAAILCWLLSSLQFAAALQPSGLDGSSAGQQLTQRHLRRMHTAAATDPAPSVPKTLDQQHSGLFNLAAAEFRTTEQPPEHKRVLRDENANDNGGSVAGASTRKFSVTDGLIYLEDDKKARLTAFVSFDAQSGARWSLGPHCIAVR